MRALGAQGATAGQVCQPSTERATAALASRPAQGLRLSFQASAAAAAALPAPAAPLAPGTLVVLGAIIVHAVVVIHVVHAVVVVGAIVVIGTKQVEHIVQQVVL